MPLKSGEFPYHKVYIGMPVYNGEKYLEASILSNLAQDYGDFALIIADNASTDRTRQICEDYAARDSRVFYLRNHVNLGAAKNYSRCFVPSNCQYFRWSNADDLLENNLVSKCVEVLDNNPDVVLTYGKTRLIDGDGNLIENYNDNLHLDSPNARQRFLKFKSDVGLSNVLYGLIRRDVLSKTALLGNYRSSDINLIGELTLYGKFFEIPEYLFSRRIHAQASSWDRSDEDKQRVFWDPSKRNLNMQAWRSFREYFRAIGRAPITLNDKCALSMYLLRSIYWEKEVMAAEVTSYVKYRLIKRN